MPVSEMTEGPVSRDANQFRPRKHSRACCRESMRCPCPKRPKGLLAETQMNCRLANTSGPVVGEHAMPVPEKTEGPVCKDAIDLRPRKHRRACGRGNRRCPCPKRPQGRLAGTQSTCVPANTAGPAVGKACESRARKDRRAG